MHTMQNAHIAVIYTHTLYLSVKCMYFMFSTAVKAHLHLIPPDSVCFFSFFVLCVYYSIAILAMFFFVRTLDRAHSLYVNIYLAKTDCHSRFNLKWPRRWCLCEIRSSDKGRIAEQHRLSYHLLKSSLAQQLDLQGMRICCSSWLR